MTYVEVVPFLPLPAGRRQTYAYRVPQDMHLKPGMLVRVPVGPRSVDGLVMRTGARRSRIPAVRLKPVVQVFGDFPLFLPAELSALQEFAELSLESTAGLLKTATSVRRPLLRSKKAPLPSKTSHRKTDSRRSAPFQIRWGSLEGALPRHSLGQRLLLVPELAIGRQALELLPARGMPAALFAQSFPIRERRMLLDRLLAGEDITLISTHAGIFLPFVKLREVFVAEAGLPAHRQWDLHPRYDARVGAVLLARAHHIPLILHSSLPSLDLALLQKQSSKGKEQRGMSLLPASSILLPRRPTDPFLTSEVVRSIREGVERKERILLFHDIVGTERLYACDTCGTSLRCEHCGGILERAGTALKCRNCGAPAGTPPSFCPRCRSPHFGPRRVGTTAITSLAKHLFPGIPVVRLDRETVRRESGAPTPYTLHPTPSIAVATERSFAVLEPQSFDQVIVLDLDRILEDGLFGAADRFLQLVTRLSSLRRGTGPLLVQTRHANLPLAEALTSEKSFQAWLEEEQADRVQLQYPPAAAMIRLEKPFPSLSKAEHAARRLAETFNGVSGIAVGVRATAGVRPRAEVLLRGTLESLRRILSTLPTGWPTDPHIPFSALLR